jgi:hypothetical protein
MAEYDSLPRGAVIYGDELRSSVVLRHTSSVEQFMHDYHRLAARTVQQRRRGLRTLAPDLLKLISDSRTLRAAWDHLAIRGGQAPGHDGRRYSDYSSAEVWSLCRALSAAIRDGTYRPQAERIVLIDKGGNRGRRPIVLLTLPDRTVQRAITTILQPLLDPGFDRYSFGYRPKQGHLRALATAEHLSLGDQRLVWVTHDIRDAFQHVSMPRLFDVLRSRFPDDALMTLLGHALTGQRFEGLRQGGSASPLMMNCYLDHFLDRPWNKKHSTILLLRFADDILLLCSSIAQAQFADAELRHLLRPTGMQLKASAAEAIRDLATGDSAKWLGLRISKTSRGLSKKLTNGSWSKLHRNLALSHTKHDSQLRADQMVQAWLKARGPAFSSSPLTQVCQRVFRTARRYGFEEIPSRDGLVETWRDGHVRWCRIRRKVRRQLEETASPKH